MGLRDSPSRIEVDAPDLSPSGPEQPERPSPQSQSFRTDAKRAALFGGGDDPAVKHARCEHDERREDRRSRDLVLDVPSLERFRREDTRSGDIDPVDAVRMRRMGSWRGRCRRAAHATNRQHHAADHRVIG
ncbi:MAG: hypothetical protein DMF84_18485 [Acidobacteria bacterium]|nr:MAG: hypothetical protein DMF84_18485 [Acidobacteriota bacterium]